MKVLPLLLGAALSVFATEASAPVQPLRFWTWPSTIAQADLQKAIDQIRSSGIETVADPATQAWTHVLVWNSDDWILLRAGETHGDELGWTLKAQTLKQHTPPGAKVWINLPPSQEIGGKIKLHEQGSNVQGVVDFTIADYVLVSALTADGPAWAWYRKDAFTRGAHHLHAPIDIAHCTPAEQPPVRTPWIAQTGSDSIGAANQLNDAAACLAAMTAGRSNASKIEKK